MRCHIGLDSKLLVTSYLEQDNVLTWMNPNLDDPDSEPRGELDGADPKKPHAVLDETTRRRNRARAMNTTFVYDYIHLFGNSAELEWDSFPEELWPCARPSTFVDVQDMVIDHDLKEVSGLVKANVNIKAATCG